jgi:hypothetical protein
MSIADAADAKPNHSGAALMHWRQETHVEAAILGRVRCGGAAHETRRARNGSAYQAECLWNMRLRDKGVGVFVR